MHRTSKAFLLLLSACLFSFGAGAQSKKYTVSEGITAQVMHTQGSGTVVVTIPGTEQITLDLTQPSSGVFQIKTTDYNFDGYRDFAFVGANAAGSLQVYDIYLYNPTDGIFEALEVPDGLCEAFGNVRLNAADKTLRSSCRNGNKSSLDIFKWTAPFALELVRSEDNSTESLEEQAEEKAAVKAEKADQRKEKREDLSDRKKARQEAKEED